MGLSFVVLTIALLTGSLPMPRVRSSHPYIRAMITEAQVRSATFRGLVNAIEATDGIVYVEEAECGHHVRACLPPLITATPDVRILRVLVDARQKDWQVMADIGHELQHVMEILGDPAVRTNDAMFFAIYPKTLSARDVMETAAAVKAEEAIEAEIRAFSRKTTTKGLPRQRDSSDALHGATWKAIGDPTSSRHNHTRRQESTAGVLAERFRGAFSRGALHGMSRRTCAAVAGHSASALLERRLRLHQLRSALLLGRTPGDVTRARDRRSPPRRRRG